MFLPNKERAVIEINKVREYLLNSKHIHGKHKAVFFQRFGYSIENAEVLQNALYQHPQDNEVASTIETRHGIKYIVEGPINCPDKRKPRIRTVWMVPASEDLAKLVTAYPL